MSDEDTSKEKSIDNLVKDSLNAKFQQTHVPGFESTLRSATSKNRSFFGLSFWKWAPITALVVTAVYSGCPQLIHMMNQRHQEVNQAQVFFLETSWQGPTDFLIDDLPTSDLFNSVPQFGESL